MKLVDRVNVMLDELVTGFAVLVDEGELVTHWAPVLDGPAEITEAAVTDPLNPHVLPHGERFVVLRVGAEPLGDPVVVHARNVHDAGDIEKSLRVVGCPEGSRQRGLSTAPSGQAAMMAPDFGTNAREET